MDTPRSSSNGLITVVCLGLLAVCGYKVYQDRTKSEQQAAPAKPAERAIAVTQAIEPYYGHLFSDLNTERPSDLVPTLSIARERLLDHHARADKEKKAVYELAAKLLEGMIDAAEERTQLLAALLKAAARPTSTLETTQAMTSSNQHFMSGQMRRSNETLKKRKPALDQVFAQLRVAEREWNLRLPKDARPETYKFSNLPDAIITVEAEGRQNPLDQRAYDQRRAVYPWRSSYYNQYGYPQTY